MSSTIVTTASTATNSTTRPRKSISKADKQSSNNEPKTTNAPYDTVQFLEEVNSIRRALLHRLDKKWRHVDEKYSMVDKLTYARGWASGHPIITVFLLTTFVICALPLICFLASLAGIIGIVVLGFLFFEGTLLTLGVSVLGVLFTFGAFLSIGFSSCVILGYLFTHFGRQSSVRFNRITQGKKSRVP